MILVICDTHCYFDTVNQQIEYAESAAGRDVACVIHLGDFGIYRSHLHDFFIKKKKRFRRPLYFIDGNHEDFDALPWLVKKYEEFFTYLPRGTVHTMAGYRFLALGGTAYMDSMITQKGAVITDQQINECLEIPGDAVDIILTHDCPADIGMPNTPGLEHFGDTGFPRSGELAAHFKPKLWLFGHHHKWHSYQDGRTAYYGLCGAWKGFGMLDDHYRFTIMKHAIEWEKTPLLEKFLIKLKIIRPDAPPY
jgi:predicted phosphodiesterase